MTIIVVCAKVCDSTGPGGRHIIAMCALVPKPRSPFELKSSGGGLSAKRRKGETMGKLIFALIFAAVFAAANRLLKGESQKRAGVRGQEVLARGLGYGATAVRWVGIVVPLGQRQEVTPASGGNEKRVGDRKVPARFFFYIKIF